MLDVKDTRFPVQRQGRLFPVVQVPDDLCTDRTLSSTDKLTAGALLSFARSKFECWPSDGTIGKTIGRSKGTVQRSLKALEDAGLIRRLKSTANWTGRLIVLSWKQGSPLAARELPQAPALDPPQAPARDKERGMGKGKEDKPPEPSLLPVPSKPEEPPTKPAAVAALVAKAESLKGLDVANPAAAVGSALKAFPPEWIDAALDVVRKAIPTQGAKHWGFVRGILRNFTEQGGPPPKSSSPAAKPAPPPGRHYQPGEVVTIDGRACGVVLYCESAIHPVVIEQPGPDGRPRTSSFLQERVQCRRQ